MSLQVALILLLMGCTGFACTLPELNIVYPRIAPQARLSGPVRVQAAYGDEGVPLVTSLTGHPLLRDAVVQAIGASPTPASCLGQTTEVIVTFTLLGCHSDRHWSRAERVNETAWNVFAPMPYTIACGEEKVTRKFPFFFVKRSVGFCRRLSNDGPVCSNSARATEALSTAAPSVR